MRISGSPRRIPVGTAAFLFLNGAALAQPIVVYNRGTSIGAAGEIFAHGVSRTNGCFPLDDETNTAPLAPPGSCPLGVGGGSCSKFGSTSVETDKSCAEFSLHASAQGKYTLATVADATPSFISVGFSAVGDVNVQAQDNGPPCVPMQMDQTIATGSVATGTNGSIIVTVPFVVTRQARMTVTGSIFSISSADGSEASAHGEWSIDGPVLCDPPVDSGYVNAGTKSPSAVLGGVCCAYPGDYTLTVRFSSTHSAFVLANCTDPSSEIAGALSEGFNLSISFVPGCSCPGDVNGNGTVDIDDLLTVINSWGDPGCGGSLPCPADLDGNGAVNVDDLMQVINHWGPCP